MEPKLESEADQSCKEETASPIITTNNQLIDDKKLESDKEEKGRSMPEKEPNGLAQKQDVKKDNHITQSDEASSLAIKEEHASPHHRKDSDTQSNYSRKSVKKDSSLSCQNPKKSEKSGTDQGELVEEKETVSENQLKICSSSATQSSPHKLTKKVEKLQPRRNLDPGAAGLQSVAESVSVKKPEKRFEDGYNWRKYGQKFVKGNKFVRSYYRCTYPSCQAKRQVERSHDGNDADIFYLGGHQHSDSQESSAIETALQVIQPETPIAITPNNDADMKTPIGDGYQQLNGANAGNDQTTPYPKANDVGDDKDDSSDSKRQKRQFTAQEILLNNRPYSRPRNIVQTVSEVDLVNDGYRWRKYGQKMVRGSPYPRSYYRCSNAGCPAKKHVERAPEDRKVVITTYEGDHSHNPVLQ